jgi:hypothetical protein
MGIAGVEPRHRTSSICHKTLISTIENNVVPYYDITRDESNYNHCQLPANFTNQDRILRQYAVAKHDTFKVAFFGT